jgi:uncharacterized membrane protein YeaQ/YmgE (transglycosylase-associated protein family)
MNAMLSIILGVLAACLLEGGRAAVGWFDETSLGVIGLVAFVFHLVAHRLPHLPTGLSPPACSGVFLLAYFLHRYYIDGDHFDCLLASVFRSLLASAIVWSAAELTAVAAQAVLHRLGRLRSLASRKVLGLVRGIVAAFRAAWQRRRRRPAPIQKTAPPPPRAVQLRQQAEAAQADYDAELAALAGLPLDEDEKQMLQDLAKQRLLQRLKQGE